METIIVRGTETRATINLALATVTATAGNIADIKPRRTAGTGKPGVVSVFEAVVVPQNVPSGTTLLEIRCRMKDGSTESFDYTIPKNNWMAISATAEGTYGKSLSGKSTTGAVGPERIYNIVFLATTLGNYFSCEKFFPFFGWWSRRRPRRGDV